MGRLRQQQKLACLRKWYTEFFCVYDALQISRVYDAFQNGALANYSIALMVVLGLLQHLPTCFYACRIAKVLLYVKIDS